MALISNVCSPSDFFALVLISWNPGATVGQMVSVFLFFFFFRWSEKKKKTPFFGGFSQKEIPQFFDMSVRLINRTREKYSNKHSEAKPRPTTRSSRSSSYFVNGVQLGTKIRPFSVVLLIGNAEPSCSSRIPRCGVVRTGFSIRKSEEFSRSNGENRFDLPTKTVGYQRMSTHLEEKIQRKWVFFYFNERNLIDDNDE